MTECLPGIPKVLDYVPSTAKSKHSKKRTPGHRDPGIIWTVGILSQGAALILAWELRFL
jgi:hypothetical protein